MILMKKIKLSIVAVVTIMCSVLTTDTLQATHIVGGNMYYQCLGNNNYRVTFEMRRDCFNGDERAQFDDPASIAVYDGNGELMNNIGRFGLIQIPFSSSDTLNEILTSECRVFGEDVCVHTTTYEAVVNLPSNDSGYVLVYQRCCRNNTLNNIIEPLETGATYAVEISPESMRLCNSTPQFNDWPDIYLCNNDWYRFDHSAFDIDGDSLVYELCVPSTGATRDAPQPRPALPPPFEDVTWAPPYSLTNMMGGTAPIRIDSRTGLLSVRPDVIGQFLIGICVKEYRNGELLTVVKRDFEFNTRVCNDAPEANFVAEPNPNCEGLEVQFVNNSTTNRDYFWYFDYDSDRSLTSTEQSPTFTFPESGRYKVRLEVTDGECLDIFTQNIGVSSAGDIQPDFVISSDDCGTNFTFKFESTTKSSQRIISHDWKIDYGGFRRSENTAEFTLNLPKEDRTATIVYTVTGETGCTETITRTVDLHYLETTPINTDITICKGSSTELIDEVDDAFTYSWSPSTGLDLSDPTQPIASPTESTEYILSLSDGICNTQISVPVTVDDDNTIVVAGADVACNGVVTLEVTSDGTNRFEWFADAEFTQSIGQTNPINFVVTEIPEVIYVRSNENKACNFKAIDLSDILVTDGLGLEISNNEAVPTCEGDEVELSATTTVDATFRWFNENNREVGTGPSVVVLPRNNEVFSVEAEGPNGCIETASFRTTIANEIDLTLSISENEIDRCFGDDLEVIAQSNSDVTIEWFRGETRVERDGSLLTNLTESAIYRAVATDRFGCSTSKELIVNVADEITYTLNESDGVVEFCFYETFELIAQTEDSDNRFEWFDAAGNVIFRGERIVLDAEDNGEITLVVRNEFGCTKEETIRVVVPDEIVIDYSIDVDDGTVELCFGDELEITASSHDGVELNWFENGRRIQNGGTMTRTPSESTVYTVVATDSRGCEVSEDLEVIVFDEIEYSLNVDDNNINFCFDETFTLTGTTDNPDLRFVWSNEDGTVIHRGSSLRLEPTDNGIVNLEVNNQFGCSVTESFNITVPPSFELDLGLGLDNNKISLCFGDELDVEVTTSADIDVVWFIDDVRIQLGNSLVTTPRASATYTIVGTDPSGCEVVEELEVEVFDEIVYDVNATDGAVSYCFDESFTLAASGTDNLSYNWVDIDGVSIGTGPELLLEDNIDRIVKLEVSDENGCIVEENITVNVFENFDISFDSEDVVYCPSEGANISIAATTEITVLWFDAEGNPIGSGSDFNFETTETTTLTAVVFSNDGCQKEQTFNLSPLSIDFINPEEVAICAGESITIEFLDNSITTPLEIDWDNKDAVSNFEPLANLTVNPTSTTLFTITAMAENGCMYEASTLVTVNDFAETLTATADPVRIAVGQTSQLEVDDILGYEYSWSPPNTLDNPNSPTPIASPVDENGTYTVTVTDENGCTATASVMLQVETAVCNETDVWLPNMFTPNGDGSNDIFKAESNFVDDFEMIIYNRWGEEVFVSNNIDNGWNGTYGGQDLEPDVYGYCVRAVCTNGVEYIKTGNVTIVK